MVLEKQVQAKLFPHKQPVGDQSSFNEVVVEGSCQPVASTSADKAVETYVMYVAIFASAVVWKRVRKPSVAAFPGLSVTPGLNPTVITASGSSSNDSEVKAGIVFAARFQ